MSTHIRTATRWKLGIATAAVALLSFVAHGQQPQQPPPQQPSEIGVVISGEPGTPPRYAVPDFVALSPDASEAAKTIGQVLWDDLNYERELYMLPRDTYASIPVARTADQVPFAAWRELGADAVVFGTVQKTGNMLTVQVRLFNVRSRQQAYGKQFSTASNARFVAHTISDEIFQQQRNLRGVARTRLAFASDRDRQKVTGTVENRTVKEIYIADYDGANQRRITVSRQLNVTPNWSPDGKAIAYTSYRRGTPDVFVSRIFEGILQNPTRATGTNYLPVFSPDGSRIAFMSGRAGNPEIFVMNADGTNVRRLTNHPAADSSPTWAPNGRDIAFTSDRSGTPQIYVMSADGSNLRRLTTGESYADRPTWSPAPFNEIAYSARTGPGFDIKVLDLASNQAHQLTFGEGSNESPAYSPNGRHIAFTSTRGAGRVEVWTMTRDGRDLRQITKDGNNQEPAWSN